LQKATKLQLNLLKNKKVIEKELSERLDEQMEQQDLLVGAVRRSMVHARPKHQVQAVSAEVKQVIHSDVVVDDDTKKKCHRVEVMLGNYCNDVTTSVSGHSVLIVASTSEGPNFSKEISIEFPDKVEMQDMRIKQEEDKLIMQVPFKPVSVDILALLPPPPAEGDPNNPMQRIAFLEGLFKSMNMSWPPEGATAHYQYLTGNWCKPHAIEDARFNPLIEKNIGRDTDKLWKDLPVINKSRYALCSKQMSWKTPSKST